jgi:hypothetical protein
MSHWAELDDNNKVLRVLVGDNNDPAGDEGYQWLIDNLGGTWVKTSYNSKIRGIYAGVGYLYNEEEDIFITPQPYPSWTRSGSFWQAPVPKPEDGKLYAWDEESLSWIEIEISAP